MWSTDAPASDYYDLNSISTTYTAPADPWKSDNYVNTVPFSSTKCYCPEVKEYLQVYNNMFRCISNYYDGHDTTHNRPKGRTDNALGSGKRSCWGTNSRCAENLEAGVTRCKGATDEC